MAKTQLIRRRIRSVKNIRQITNAMEMVAASKLRRSQEAALALRRYAVSLEEIMRDLITPAHALYQTPVSAQRLVIVYSSDRGLAGAYNSNIFRQLIETVRTLTPTEELALLIIGTKGGQFASRLKAPLNVLGVYNRWPTLPSIRDIRPLAATTYQLFTEGKVRDVTLLYTEYHSALRQQVVRLPLLPLQSSRPTTADADSDDAINEPSATELVEFAIPRYLETQIWRASLEAVASEEAMRMVAMQNASRNAGDLMDDLTLTYNNARQATITQELAEISAGTQAVS